jgi:adenylate kinase family enzyme
MRVVVVGTSGSGKSTFAQALAQVRGAPFIELDLINWRPGWVDRSKSDPEGFIADVEAATDAPCWTLAGNYGLVRERVRAKATDLVWLDFPKALVMRQVIARSFKRAFSGRDVFPGCREDVWRTLSAEAPIRWAWSTHARRAREYAAVFDNLAGGPLRLHRCRSRAEADATLDRLSRAPG